MAHENRNRGRRWSSPVKIRGGGAQCCKLPSRMSYVCSSKQVFRWSFTMSSHFSLPAYPNSRSEVCFVVFLTTLLSQDSGLALVIVYGLLGITFKQNIMLSGAIRNLLSLSFLTAFAPLGREW
ncbi:hypothetical protein TorRG33x02_047900 [Trema orientale]|uniref:Uncharacterized protein n=1 Tax=Trema orientale TaxID=63057 RepID=A0A2P5FPF6_TREOI|nr:hypothetical protein TorRG33x02_047900 [Trema orientale]